MYLNYPCSRLLSEPVEALRYESIPRFPSITRDIALVVDKEMNAGTLEQSNR